MLNEQEQYAERLKDLTDDELREEFREAGDVYEYYGGYWTLRLVREEMKRRERLPN